MYINEFVALRDYNTYHTGGQARYFAMPANAGELVDTLTWATSQNIPHELIGYGANMLVSDAGYEGLVICLRGFENWVTLTQHNSIIAGAGVLLNDVVKFACDNGLAGMANLAGIPGTVGGAARMNAGAFGTEMKDVVSSLNILEADSEFRLSQRKIDAAEAQFSYRKAAGLDAKIVIALEFSLQSGDKATLNDERKAILSRRQEKQPLSLPSCGSVFKRPKDGYAGELIERCGLKGLRFGGAMISDKHANFILNCGEATSADIYGLIQQVKYIVNKECGVFLEEEVRYLGDFKA
jgi:UDP-N-acetylmuramate dehydrogenase